jgi:hypothetical protein
MLRDKRHDFTSSFRTAWQTRKVAALPEWRLVIMEGGQIVARLFKNKGFRF